MGVKINMDGGIGEEAARKVLEGRKVRGTMAKLWKEKMIFRGKMSYTKQ